MGKRIVVALYAPQPVQGRRESGQREWVDAVADNAETKWLRLLLQLLDRKWLDRVGPLGRQDHIEVLQPQEAQDGYGQSHTQGRPVAQPSRGGEEPRGGGE